MIVDQIRALRRPIPADEQLAALAHARNDALEEAARVVEDAFSTSGDLRGAIIGVESPAHPVGAAVRAYTRGD
jgi:hypothetical protein